MRRGVRRPAMESPGGYSMVPSSSTPDLDLIKHSIKSELTPSPHLLDHGYGATPQNQIMPVTPAFSAPAVKRRLNMEMPRMIVPIKTEFKAPPPKRQRRNSPAKKHTRFDTSLGILTKKFTTLLEQSPNGVVNLNQASEELGVQKRRIYDITNVLEGIGILEKKSKNNIQWKGGTKGSHAYTTLQNELKSLEDRENNLDQLIRTTQSELCKLNENRRYAYVTYADIHSIAEYKNRTVMAIKAPPDSNFSIPQPPGREYKMQLKSESGEIEVFLCPENLSPKNKQIPPPDPLLKDFKDIKLCNSLLHLKTPPVPDLDSPIISHQDQKPISSEVCRSLTFSKDPVFESLEAPNSVEQTLSSFDGSLPASKPTIDSNLSPEDNRTTFSSCMFPTFDHNSKTNKITLLEGTEEIAQHIETTATDFSDGLLDSMFYSEPLITLEPLSHSEFSFSLDQEEGMAELFDLFC